MDKMVDMKTLFNEVYENRKVLVTGHTGFKGAWLCILLNKLEIKYYTSTYKPKNINWKQTYKILIAGPLKLNMWINKIGTKNPCKVSRIEIWKEHGFCPPFTTYNQRINILEGKLNPKELYGPVM